MVTGIVIGTMLVNYAVKSPTISIALDNRTSPEEDLDIDQIQGRTEQLVGKIQERYGIARDEARRQFDTWSPRS